MLSETDITIGFKNVSCKIPQVLDNDSLNSYSIPTILSPFTSLYNRLVSGPTTKQDYYRVKDISGIINPGSMTLVLAPPGGGKTTYLKVLSDRLPSTGAICYNHCPISLLKNKGIDIKKLSSYCDQEDILLPLLTVREAITFYCELNHDSHPFNNHSEKVVYLLEMFSLTECSDVKVGEAGSQGISGGQRRRLSLALSVVHGKVLFLDEWSNGLDAAVAEDIAYKLKDMVKKDKKSVVCTLQQPSPDLLRIFDKIVILKEGEVVFDGVYNDIIPFFRAMGYRCGEDVDVSDFLIDVLTQPLVCLQRMKSTNKDHHVLLSSGEFLDIAETPRITTEEMVGFYKSSPLYRNMEISLQSLGCDSPYSGVDEVIDEVSSSGVHNTDNATHSDTSVLKCSITFDSALTTTYSTGYSVSLKKLVSLVLYRQWLLVIRNTSMLLPRISTALVMGLYFGSLYYHVALNNYILRVAALLCILTQGAYSNLMEAGLVAATNKVVYMENSWYPSWVYVVSSSLMSIPVIMVEMGVFCLLTYFMNYNTFSASCFFIAYFLSICCCVNMSAWFRLLSSCVGDPKIVSSLTTISVGIFMINGGLFINKGSIPSWMLWLYYISPFSWGTRALVNNEFLASRYDVLVSLESSNPNSPQERLGNLFIQASYFEKGYDWIGYGVLYILGVAVLCVLLQCWMTEKKYYEVRKGTGRDSTSVSLLDLRSHCEQEQDNEPEIDHDRDGNRVPTNETDNHHVPTSETHFFESYANSSFIPSYLTFENVSYSIPVPGETQQKKLLNDISGFAKPGQLVALMGASGSGKTTLLDVLAGRRQVGEVEGVVKVNGLDFQNEDNRSLLHKQVRYVEQFDSLFKYDTVKECLAFIAKFTLLDVPVYSEGNNNSKADLYDIMVQDIIAVLELSHIEGKLIKDCSLSEVKKVSIGVELVSNPSLIFLDEPTTGLDSKSAQDVMRVLKKLTSLGRTVICTIHQPSSELIFMFDSLILLASGGHQVFFGDVGYRFREFITYFESVPGVGTCQPHFNPASWMLREIYEASSVIVEDKHTGTSSSVSGRSNQVTDLNSFISHYQASLFKSCLVEEMRAMNDPNDVVSIINNHIENKPNLIFESLVPHNSSLNEDKPPHVVSFPSPIQDPPHVVSFPPSLPLHSQLIIIMRRQFLSYYRNPSFIYTRVLSMVVISLLFSCIYMNLEIVDESTSVAALSSRVYSVVFVALQHCGMVIPIMFEHRLCFNRERFNAFYNPILTTVAVFLNEMFWIVIDGLFFVNIIYWMLEFEPSVYAYFVYFCAFWLFSFSFVGMAVLVTSVSPSQSIAEVLEGVIYNLILSFLGLTVTKRNVPSGYKWLFETMISSHITHIISDSQFKPRKDLISTVLMGKMTVSDYMQHYLGMDFGQVGLQFLYASLYTIVFIILTVFCTFKLVFTNK